tara:strand:- start:310 stop:1122 length:813 start_codon:yes stop_codon:yes gene_type:complete
LKVYFVWQIKPKGKMEKVNCKGCNELIDEELTLFQKCCNCNSEEILYNIDDDIISKMTNLSINNIDILKNKGVKWVTESIINDGMKMTELGSLTYAFFGPKKSEQSINIKLGKFGEFLFKEIVNLSPNLELLKCGVQVVNEKGNKKDVDLIWVDVEKKVLRYRELKGNIELDSEKIPATIDKINEEIFPCLKKKYPEYKDFEVDIGILAWGVYNRNGLKKGLSQIKKCENKNVKVDHVEDFLKSVNFQWSKEDYNNYILSLGRMIKDQLF